MKLQLENKDFPIHIYMNEYDKNYQPHWHKEVELIYILKGSFKIWLDNETYVLKEHDLAFISANQIHYISENLEEFNYAAVRLNNEIFTDFNQIKFNQPVLSYSAVDDNHSEEVHRLIEQYILDLIKEYNCRKQAYKWALMARTYDLMTIILRYLPVETYTRSEMDKINQQIEILQNIIEHIRRNFKDNIPLEEIAKVVNLHPHYFTRYFKKCIGMTFVEYVHCLRIEEAKILLYTCGIDKRVIDIAEMCGFECVKTFNRVFKKITGSTPTQYKKRILMANKKKIQIDDNEKRVV